MLDLLRVLCGEFHSLGVRPLLTQPSNQDNLFPFVASAATMTKAVSRNFLPGGALKFSQGSIHTTLSASSETVVTASIRPELFIGRGVRATSRTLIVTALALLMLVGFGFRSTQLSAEGLSEDELNKLEAVRDYRAHGLTSINGEHPMLMKALLTASIVAAEHWNEGSLVSSYPSLYVSTETALRLPGALFGTLTTLLVFLLTAELFGTQTALIAAALWAFDPSAIGFNRIAKEDSFLLFFFLLANVFWLRGQRIAESGRGRPEPYYWATAAAFGAMMASKYMPHYLGISCSYYHIFQGLPANRWRMGFRRWLIFFAIMGATFVLCNPTILLPGTWHEMKVFAGEQRIGHDSYEFMGTLYRNQMTLWLKGLPWHFYYVFMAVKIPLLILVSFITGLVLLFRQRLGDGRFFLLFWLLMWFLPFTVLGGKFTRYFTMALPVVLMTAAIGINFVAHKLSEQAGALSGHEAIKAMVRSGVAGLVLLIPAIASASAMPHYRLFTTALGGGWERAGSYFPHDEFYDSSVREAAALVALRARSGARVASETPSLVAYYARVAGRGDLVSISLSDRTAMQQMANGDFVIVARGRRYFSNDAIVARLNESATPAATISLGSVPSIRVFALDEVSLAAISEAVK
jgi:Dolichyl-phosphate-mannose-protein mannosyltransferase